MPIAVNKIKDKFGLQFALVWLPKTEDKKRTTRFKVILKSDKVAEHFYADIVVSWDENKNCIDKKRKS